MRENFDAIVIGAGPAGSSVAILLARAGWAVALVEKQRFPRRKVCGECIAASNLPLLHALGIGSAFDAAAGPELRRVALMVGDVQAVAELPAASPTTQRWGRALGRETLDTLLLDQARKAGAAVFQPWDVRSLDGSPGRWECGIHEIASFSGPGLGHPGPPALHNGSPRVLKAPVVIAANGSWEVLRSERATRAFGRPARHQPSDLLAFKANYRGSTLADGVLPVIAFEGGYGGMVVGDGGVTTLACCIRADRLAAVRRERPGLSAGEAVESHLRTACRGVRVALDGAVREGAWLAAGPLDPGIRLASQDGLFRVGNAAGEAHPIVGEGMSMALQGAWLLCETLLSETLLDGTRWGEKTPLRRAPFLADPTWQRRAMRRYARRWRHSFGLRLALAALFAQAAMRPVVAAAAVRVARRWPTLLTLGARCCGKARSAVDASRVVALLASHAAADRPAPGRLHPHPPCRMAAKDPR